MPDDGDWECVDLDGAVVCRNGSPPAGVPTGAGDPGWVCATSSRGEPVCVDLSPDHPDDRAWRCYFDSRDGVRRYCALQEADAAALGQACDEMPCAVGLQCVDGRCAPDQLPTATCWVDADCDGVCRLGSCTAGGQ